jgi:hypothetical protein
MEIDRTDMFRTLLLLDAALPALDAAAEREKRREAGKRMRQITEQQRAEMAREHVAYMAATYGIEV